MKTILKQQMKSKDTSLILYSELLTADRHWENSITSVGSRATGFVLTS